VPYFSEEVAMRVASIDRRSFLKTAGASVAVTAAPWVHTAGAAGSLAVGFWDHWVPHANDELSRLAMEWAAREKVDLKIDFITSQGGKILLTIATEAQAASGHDIIAMPTWLPSAHANSLEPVDDVMQALVAQHGPVDKVVEYIARSSGRWVAIPATAGSQMKGPCARIDLLKQHAGIDIVSMYPPTGVPDPAQAGRWTWDAFLVAAERCHKAGFPFGIGFGTTADSVDSAGAMFSAFGAELVDAKGNIAVDSTATRQVLEFAKRLAQWMPPDVFAWDDASNNKWLISGKGALIMNPPSAWAVAKRDNPQLAGQLWTFPAPRGPKGRFQPGLSYFWGIWKFSRNKPAAKSLLAFLSQRSSVERLVAASGGFDMPGFAGLRNLGIWSEVGPPKGTLANYPPSGDQIVSISGAPAPPPIAVQIYTQAIMTKMIAKFVQSGDKLDRVVAWARSELEGLMRS
jgi:ABC-type glycerol-3-phosphate transport system substrate-binding protein